MPLKRLRNHQSKKNPAVWDALPWKTVDVNNSNLGDFGESVFFGLEELDGNSYMLNKQSGGMIPQPIVAATLEDEVASEPKKKVNKKLKKNSSIDVCDEAVKSNNDSNETYSDETDADDNVKQTQRQKKKQKSENMLVSVPIIAPKAVDYSYLQENSSWDGISISALLHEALNKLGFHTPTPIQTVALPLTTKGLIDIVGAAETGSGKTLVG